MVKIFIDPGHGGSDPGAVGNGLQEKNLTLTISRHLRDILLNEYQGAQVRMSRTSDTTVSLANRATMANNWNADYFVSVHINAGGGTGFESFIHRSRSSRTVQYQNVIHPEIINRINVTDRGKKSANFAVLRNTRMPAILTENLFIDNSTDAARLRDGAFLQRVARGHAAGIAEAFNLRRNTTATPPAAPPTSPSPSPPAQPPAGTLYKVQAGAFSNRANAERLATQLRGDGYTPFVFEEDSLAKVQVGAFNDRANAEALVEELQAKGYSAIILIN